MQAVSPEALRLVFLTLAAPSLAAILDRSPACRKTLNKSSITKAMLDTDRKRMAIHSKVQPILRKEKELCETLTEAWTDEHQQIVSTVQELGKDASALSAFVSQQPSMVGEVLAALSLIPKAIAPKEPQRSKSAIENPYLDEGGPRSGESDREKVEALKKELATLRKQVKAKEEKDRKDKAKNQHELVTCRRRLSEVRSRLAEAEKAMSEVAQERTSLKTRIAYLEKQLNSRAIGTVELQGRLDKLHADLEEAKRAIREATTAAETAEAEKQTALDQLHHAINHRSELIKENLLPQLLSPPVDKEKAELAYTVEKARRDFKRSLQEAIEAGPADLLQVWTAWLREEEDTIALVIERQGIPSPDEVQDQLHRIWDLDYQLNLRLSIVQRLRLLCSRLLVHYEDTGSE